MALNAPTGLVVVEDKIGQITISFTDQNGGAAWHTLERALDGTEDWVPIADTEEKSDTQIIDQDPDGLQSAGDTYKYRIRADDGVEMSGPSAEVSVKARGAALDIGYRLRQRHRRRARLY